MKRIRLIVNLAIKGILANKLRSLLTVLGIIIGIASVIALSSIGKGAEVEITKSIDSLGSNLVTVVPGADLIEEKPEEGDLQNQEDDVVGLPDSSSGPGSGDGFASSITPLTVEDYDFLKKNIDENQINGITPLISQEEIIEYEGTRARVSINCVSEDYLNIIDKQLDFGRFITQQDIAQNAGIAVAGISAVKELFSNPEDAIGQRLDYGSTTVELVGVIEEQDTSFFDNPNYDVYLPYTFCTHNVTQSDYISAIQFSVTDTNDMDSLIENVENDLLVFKGESEDEQTFSIVTSEDILNTVSDITGIFTILLSSIASISLLVGGIGISNIMLVSVTERTKEIGLRKAIGARRLDILLQFLSEAVFLTLLGGILGIIAGFGMGQLASVYVGFNPSYTIDIILLATLISIAIGLVFGFIPAYNASKLNPVDALRYE